MFLSFTGLATGLYPVEKDPVANAIRMIVASIFTETTSDVNTTKFPGRCTIHRNIVEFHKQRNQVRDSQEILFLEKLLTIS